jgi:hypothetical protein
LCAVLALSQALHSADERASAAAAQFDKAIKPFLANNCYECHDSVTMSGDLDLTSYKTVASVLEGRKRWEDVLWKLQRGEMPPKGMPRPDPAELKTVIAWIQDQFASADHATKPEAGSVTARRLNRTEYNNTVCDVLDSNARKRGRAFDQGISPALEAMVSPDVLFRIEKSN